MAYTIHSFYQFFEFPDYRAWQEALLTQMESTEIRGSILLAAEGINGTVSGTPDALAALLALLHAIPAIAPLSVKSSQHETLPFGRAKVKLKKELISLGEEAHPAKQVGTYVSPQKWNDLISDPEVVVIDARNSYEAHLGSFQGAINPETRKFTQLPAFTRQQFHPDTTPRIATFCTGGIRCEKYTAWLLDQGFTDVYHLDGGILNYLENIPEAQSLWQGSCYVFDERIGVGHGLQPTPELSTCQSCGHPLTAQDRQHSEYKEGLACPHCNHYPPSNV